MHLASRLTPRPDTDPSAARAVLDGVADEVLEDSPQRRLRRRGPAGRSIRDVVLDLDAGSVDERSAETSTMSCSSGPIATGRAQAALAGLDAGELEDLLDHIGQPPPLAAHELAVLPDLRARLRRRRRRGCRPAERITASGVRSSCETAATNSICWRARSCARRVDSTSSPTLAPRTREDARADDQVSAAAPR